MPSVIRSVRRSPCVQPWGRWLPFPPRQAAAAVPTCGSSDQVHNAPYDCATRRTIDGTSFRVHLHVPVTGGVRVTFRLSEPRPVGTELHVQLRVGVDGPVSIDRGIQPRPTRRPSASTSGNLAWWTGCSSSACGSTTAASIKRSLTRTCAGRRDRTARPDPAPGRNDGSTARTTKARVSQKTRGKIEGRPILYVAVGAAKSRSMTRVPAVLSRAPTAGGGARLGGGRRSDQRARRTG